MSTQQAASTARPSSPIGFLFSDSVRSLRVWCSAPGDHPHAGGVSEVRLPQHVMGNHWRFLGEWHFPAGKVGKVVLSNEGSDSIKNGVGEVDESFTFWAEWVDAF